MLFNSKKNKFPKKKNLLYKYRATMSHNVNPNKQAMVYNGMVWNFSSIKYFFKKSCP